MDEQCFISWVISVLKRKYHHFDEIYVTGCTESCHFDNFQCSQWWKFHQMNAMSHQMPCDISRLQWCNTLRSRQNGRYFPDDILNAFSLMKMCKFWLKFHWSLFPMVQLAVFRHWLMPSHYLNQWWPRLVPHVFVTQPGWVNWRNLAGLVN